MVKVHSSISQNSKPSEGAVTEEQKLLLLHIASKKQLNLVEAADYVGISVQAAKQILLQTTRQTESSIRKPDKNQPAQKSSAPLMADHRG